MVFLKFAQERVFPTLKSGLLCAIILTPVAALAEPEFNNGASPQTTSQIPNNVADIGVPPAIAHAILSNGSQTGALPQITVATLDSTAKTNANAIPKPSAWPKVASLSQHIQRTYKVSETKATQIVQEAIRSGDLHQLEPELILAVIAVESMFRERAVSRVGARGLMQVMPGYHRSKVQAIGGSRALFDPAKNIHTGSQILVLYINNHSGDLRRALLNYNGSLGSRSSYADRVIRIYRDLQRVTTES